MEVEIEKIVKAQNEAQSAAQVADIKWKLNSRSVVMLSSHSWTKPSSHKPQHAGPSARRIAGTEYHQQLTPKRSFSLSKSILNRSQRSDRQLRKPRTTRILRSRAVYPRIHSTTYSSCCGRATETCEEVLGGPSTGLDRDSSQRETSCRDEEQGSDDEELTLGDEQQHPADTERPLPCTQMTSVNGCRGDECQNHACAETKSSESKRTSRLVRHLNLTRGPGEERNTESRKKRTRRRSKPRMVRRSNECSTARNILTKEKLKDKSQHIMKKCKVVNYVDKETSSGT